MVASSRKQPRPSALECGFGKKTNNKPTPKTITPPTTKIYPLPPPLINNILIINNSNKNNGSTSSSRGGRGARYGGARCRCGKLRGGRGLSTPCPPRPGPGHRGTPEARSAGAAAPRRAAESGHLRSALLRASLLPSLSASQPAGHRCPLRAVPQGHPAARAAHCRAKARSQRQLREQQTLPVRAAPAALLAERRGLPSEAIRRSLLPASALPGLTATTLTSHQL